MERYRVRSKAALMMSLAALLLLNAEVAAGGTIIHESATLGPTGQTYGWGLGETQFLGSRFSTDQQVNITAVGGHLVEGTAGNLFGAIIRLTGPGGVPQGSPFSGSEVVASTVFDPCSSSTDFRAPLTATLEPGNYALVFGTGRLGSTGGAGAMPWQGQSNLPGASYIIWNSSDWYDTNPDPPPRFVVEGTYGYCQASGTSCAYEYISSVQVGEINNPTACDYYSDYTHLSATMQTGTGYLVTVSNGAPLAQNQCGIWVDWNADQDFEDANEPISVNGTPGQGPYTAIISPPPDASLGDTRMRIRIMFTGDVLPCGDTRGEVEDYTITVTEAAIRGDLVTPAGVDFRDFAVLARQWMKTPGIPSADIAPPGGDGVVDWLDLDAQVDNWLAGLAQ